MTTAEFYNKISNFYPFIKPVLDNYKKDLFREIADLNEGVLLEIGVGYGHDLKHYQKHKIIGIDNSSEMLSKAIANKTENCRLELMSADNMHFPNSSIDYIILSYTLSVFPDPDKVLNECYRVLKSGGRLLILNHFTPNNPLKCLDYLFNPISKRFHFRSYFRIESFKVFNKFDLIKKYDYFFNYFNLLIFRKNAQ